MKGKLKKIIGVLCLAAISLFAFAACDNNRADPGPGPDLDPDPPIHTPPDTDPPVTVGAIAIKLNGNSASVAAGTEGVTVSGSTITITKAGAYEFSGTLNDGNVVITVAKTDKVDVILAGVTISSSTTAPFYITSCDRVTFELKDGTNNVLKDAANYKFEGTETKPNACIYSKDDMTIKGNGSLNVTGNFNNGIGCKNDIRIKSGNITVSAKNNAIKGNDSVEILGGKITILKCDDGIKTDNVDELTKGFVWIENATVTITALDDGIVANSKITVKSSAKVNYAGEGKQYKCDGGQIVLE